MNMNGFVSRSSSIGRHVLHVSFKVKYCHKIFEHERIRPVCKLSFEKTITELGIKLYEIGFDKNHVHMIMDVGLLSIPKAAKHLKGRSTKILLKAFPWMKKKYFWRSGLWNPATYFDSVGNNQDRVSRYVRNQGGYKPG